MSYFLLENPNPHAYGGFHGYTSRTSDVRLLVVHTSESAFDTSGPDTGAENVARYLSRTDRQASYHDIADSDSHVPLLPHSYTAFGARGFNSMSIHMAFAGEASRWDSLSDAQVDARLTRLATVARQACAEWDIPIVRLTGADARADGARGICGHADLDPTRRSDPGDQFPWSRFLHLLEDDMPLTDADVAKIVKAVATRPVPYTGGVTAEVALSRTYRTVAALNSLVARIAKGDTLTDEQIAQVVRDAAKNIKVDVTVTPSE